MQGRTTITDLARELGLSVGTVSAALNNRQTAKPETRKRVLEAAERAGYVRSYAARSMSEGRTRKLDLIILTAGGSRLDGIVGPFLLAADEAAEARGYRLGMNVISNDVAFKERVSRLVDERGTDGLIILNPGCSDFCAALRDKKIPYLTLGRPAQFDPANVSVSTDNVRLGRDVGHHLSARGRKAVLFLAPRILTFAFDRFSGLRSSTTGSLLWIDPHRSKMGAKGALNEAMDNGTRFDAVVTADDVLALGALQLLQWRGRIVPDDVALVSTEDDIAQHFNPALTSVDLHPDRLGNATVSILADLIEHQPCAPLTLIDHDLISRSST